MPVIDPAPLSDSERNLLKAAKEGNQSLLNVALWRAKRFDVRDAEGNNPLHLACTRSVNKEEIIKLLVERPGMDVNVRNNAGETPLHRLAYRGDSRAVGFLLEAFANPTVLDNEGNSPAHSYAASGFINGLEVLLEQFYRPQLLVNQQNNAGDTPLHLAAKHPEMVHMLLIKGADARIRNAAGQLPEDLCEDEVVQKLVRGSRKGAEENAAKALRELAATQQQDSSDDKLLQDEVRLLMAQQAASYLDKLPAPEPTKAPKPSM